MFFTSFLPLWVSMVLFDNESVVIHDRLPLGRVPRMTEKEYFTRGCTALLDAVGGAIHHIGNIHMLIVGYQNKTVAIGLAAQNGGFEILYFKLPFSF